MDTKWNGTEHDPGGEPEDFAAARVRQTAETPEDAPGVLAVQPGRRGKAAIGFLAFFLGVTLTLGSLGAMAERLVMQRGALPDWSGDWQNSREFRDEVSSYLLRFLNLAADGELNWYDGETVVVESWEGTGWTLREALAENDPRLEADDPLPGASPADAAFRDDQNVLYSVWRNGRRLYGNQKLLRPLIDRSLEGYNFYLTFGDGKVTIFKDGAQLDVYGDGIYDGDSLWFVPGYDNFPAGETLEDVTVYMAVREEPTRYWVQSANGNRYYYGSMYSVAQRARESRTFYLRQLVLLGLGALCLCVWLAFRREKKLADAKIASWTVHVWTEIWMLLALVPLGWLLAAGGWQELYWACRELWWRDWEPMYPSQLVYGAAGFLLSGLPGLLALGWLLWLAFNNRRYNPREKRRSLLRSLFRALRKLLRSLRMKDLERPVEKRLARTIAAGTAALALILTALLIFLVSLLPNIGWYGPLWLAVTVLLVLLAAAVLAALISSARSLRLAWDLGRLHRQIEAIRAGDLSTPLDLPGDADLHKTAEALNDIQSGMSSALADQTRSERMKVELVSNVSHDLKTPLTSILSYAELLRQEDLPPAAADYARIIDEKARRLKGMVQDVFEVSKAAADQLPVKMERLDLGKLLRQTLADLDDPIRKSGLAFKIDLPGEPVMIDADGKRLYRVFQNLLDNALRYALAGSRVYLTLKTAEGQAETSVRSTSRDELPEGVDFTARFVRGDESRTDGGSGLGLSIASSFTEACGGTFRVETVADLFTAVVTFPLAGEEAA